MDGYRLRSAHGDTIDPRQPLPVDTVESQETSSVSPTITYNGKDAAGSISITSVLLKPIIEDQGSRVGSYWGLPQNMVYKALADGNPAKGTSWLTSVTETAGIAAITVYDPDKNLEEMFESLTTTVKRFIVKVYDTSGGTLYGWVMGVAASSDVYTFDIFNNRLTEGNQDWVGTLGNFDNTALDKVEIYFYNSSIAFGTGTAYTEEVDYPKEYSKNREQQIRYAETLSNGQFFVDYMRGEIIGPKADATASEVVTYNVWSSTIGGSSGPATNVDLDKIAGVAISAKNAPFAEPPLGVGMEFEAIGALSTDGGTAGDKVPWKASAEGVPYTHVATVDGGVSAVVADDSAQDATPGMMNVGGEYRASDTTYTDGDATILQTDVNGYAKIRSKAYDEGAQADKVGEVNPLSEHHEEVTLADVTDETSATNYYYVDMDGFRYFSFQLETSGATPADTLTVTVEATNQDDGTAQANCTYQDVTNALFGVASWVDTDAYAIADTPTAFKYVRIKTVTAGGNNDADYTIYFKKMW